MHKSLLFLTLCFGAVILHAQTIQWSANIGNFGQDGVTASAVDSVGNVYVTGIFEGTIDLDPGEGSALLFGVGINDMYMAKYSPQGEVIWYYSIGIALSGGLFPSSMICRNNDIWICGKYEGFIELDPGPGDAFFATPVNSDLFVAHYDTDGNYILATTFDGNATATIQDMAVDAEDQIVICGSFNDTMDADPSAAELLLVAQGWEDAFAMKLHADMSLAWAHTFTATDGPEAWDVATNDAGEVYCAGLYRGPTDFNSGNANGLADAGMFSELFLTKFSAGGSFEWMKSLGGATEDFIGDLIVDETNHLYLIGSYDSAGDFDPGPGEFLLEGGELNSPSKIFVSYLDSNGEFIWAKSYGDGMADMSPGACELSADKLLISGKFSLADAHLSTNEGNSEIVLNYLVGEDAFAVWTNRDGDLIHGFALNGNTSDGVSGIHLAGNSVVASGLYGETLDLDPGPSSAFITASHQTKNGFVVSLDFSSEVYVDLPLCYGDSVYLNNTWYYEEGNVDVLDTNRFGMDSLIHYQLYTPYLPAGVSYTSMCGGEWLSMYTFYSGDTYLWNTGETTPTCTVTNSGLYWCEVTGNGCTIIDSIQITVLEIPVASIAYWIDCYEVGVVANATGNGPFEFNWDYPEFALGDSINYSGPGYYHVTAIDVNGCATDAEVTLEAPVVTCQGDLNGDYIIGMDDIIMLIAEFGNTEAFCQPYDMNNDGIVDINDVLDIIVLMGGICGN